MSAVLVIVTATNAHAVCYVSASVAGGMNNGTSWGNAYADLQLALSDALCTEVWVAKGVYKPTSSSNRSLSFIVKPGVALYGGFSGDGSESSRDSRDVGHNVTVLSGDIDGNDANATSTNIDETPTDISGANSYHVVKFDGTTSAGKILASTILDGFVITGGDADASDSVREHANGGALYCDGAGMGHDCSPTLSNLTFSGNYGYFGGAIYCDGFNGNCNPIILRAKFSGNSAEFGGAIYDDGTSGGNSSPEISSTVFIANNATFIGGAMMNLGGKSNPALNDVMFIGNSAGTVAGAIENSADDAHGSECSPRITNVTFAANHASIAGALENEANGSGNVSAPILVNTTFYKNSADRYGGAIHNQSVNFGQVNPILASTTFNSNSAARGGAMYNSSSEVGGTAPLLRNVILWGDSATASDAEIFSDSSTPSIDYSIVQGGCPFESVCGSHLLTSDPLLSTLADHGGFSWTLLPNPGSSAIDAGDSTAGTCPTIDQRNFPRIDGYCDVGAVEVQLPEDIIFRNGFDFLQR